MHLKKGAGTKLFTQVGSSYPDMPKCKLSDRWASFRLAKNEKTKLSVLHPPFLVWLEKITRETFALAGPSFKLLIGLFK